ncbi:hypothetical protein [Pelagibacterium sediminicola]|uniref:hypothetical protein n=1 Tax=Pelagibacterium sediminicola TaxID=2248761 RepID=UPI000E31306B|nr:hypothetical protein [Pelagibacterium sediminicola]
MLDLAWWLIQHWYLVLFGAAIMVAYIVGGWRAALAVATLGAGALIYRKGGSDAEARYRQRQERAKREREEVEQNVGAMGEEDVQRELGKWNRD